MTKYHCPEYDTDNDHSCLWSPPEEGDRHIVFSRRIARPEWSVFSERVDEVWDNDRKDWDAEGMARIMREVTGDPDIVASMR